MEESGAIKQTNKQNQNQNKTNIIVHNNNTRSNRNMFFLFDSQEISNTSRFFRLTPSVVLAVSVSVFLALIWN